MFNRFFRRDRTAEGIATSLYGAIVAQARSPELYAAIGVPDNVSGRFEMVVLHLVLLARRLERSGEGARTAGQAVFDLFCRDMDASLREMGVGDLSVPKRMREIGEAYFGRTAAYGPGLTEGDPEALAEVFRRTVYSDARGSEGAQALAAYALACAESLSAQEETELLSGKPDFPPVETVPAGAEQ